MTLQQLRYAIAISETGSFNKAAEVLYVAQPSLSGAIHQLEKELGITIFHRGGRGVTLTNDGVEFIAYARQVCHQYELLLEKYGKSGTLKKKFAVSTQHYSFAVKSFVDLVKQFNTAEYEFAIRETKTREVIEDVSTLKSEIGILYLSSFNRNAILKLLNTNGLEFHPLIDCRAYVYLWKGHPLAKNQSIRMEELSEWKYREKRLQCLHLEYHKAQHADLDPRICCVEKGVYPAFRLQQKPGADRRRQQERLQCLRQELQRQQLSDLGLLRSFQPRA